MSRRTEKTLLQRIRHSFYKKVMNGAILRRVLEASQSLRTGAGFDYVQEFVGPGMFVR